MISGRAMYIWNLQASLKGGAVASLVTKAEEANISSLWVEIADGNSAYDNVIGNNLNVTRELVGRCNAAGISVLGYHVPHCAPDQAALNEAKTVGDLASALNLAGVAIDNEDGPGFFRGTAATAATYGRALRTALHAENRIAVMSSNDIIPAHPRSYATIIGGFIDANAPQVYYGQSPSVASRLKKALDANSTIQAPFFPIGAAFLRKPGETNGGFLDPKQGADWTALFIGLAAKLHQSDPNKYPGYGFWDWQEAPDEVWEVLTSTAVFPIQKPVVTALSAPVAIDLEEPTTKPLGDLLQILDKRANCIALDGATTKDLNIPGNILIVVNEGEFYSIDATEVVDQEVFGDGISRVWVKRGTRAWRSVAFSIGGAISLRETMLGMEDLPESPMVQVPGMPTEAMESHRQSLALSAAPAGTIAAAAAAYNNRCVGADRYANNCAHFLSDAFIRAGFDELKPGASADHFITARCGTTAKRAIRARDMWHWFQSKATETSSTIKRNTGLWAVFQLDETKYWGGHVVIIDADAWTWHGTGCHWDWGQHAYKW